MEMIVEGVIAFLVENLISTTLSVIPKLHFFGRKEDQVVAEIRQWKIILEDLRCVLQDAEDKKQDDQVVGRWLDDLEELIYDVEDIMEVFNYEAVRHDLMELKKLPSERFSMSWSFLKRSKTSWSRSEMLDKLRAVTDRIQSLKNRKESLNLLRLSVRISAKQKRNRDPSVSVPSEPVIVARDEEKEAILRILLTQEDGEATITVIPIVGMPGLGKTTLARCVYHDSRVQSSFDAKGWVCVSSDYDTKRISKEILQSVCNCGEVADKMLDWIQCKLEEELRNKKFLLVLDDIWNEKYEDWNALQPPFMRGSSGSRIIVTTRNQNVAKTIGTVDPITPRLFSDEECWALLCRHARLDHNATLFPRFEEVGKQIAGRCSGLPLAAVSVGGLLRNKTRVEHWKAILNKMWKDRGNDVTSVLMMSYDDLNSMEKRCFSFLSLFPKDFKFEKNHVVLMWVGAGLIQLEEEEKNKIEIGLDVFDGLLTRSLLSQQRDSKGLYSKMHDLIRDVAKQVCRFNRYIAKVAQIDESFKSIRHLSFHELKVEDIVSAIVKEKEPPLHLRSFWTLQDDFRSGLYDYCIDMSYDLKNMFTRLKCIRVLHLRGQNIPELPESIGQLRLLRYLDVSGSSIQRLPTSITVLCNLEVLTLFACHNLQQLPERIGNLTNLCYLNIAATHSLKELPEGIMELRRLRFLSDFKIGQKFPMSSLVNFNLLQGSLSISNLQNVAAPEEARLAQLSEKRLEELTLRWDSAERSQTMAQMEFANDILEQLQPCEDLKELHVQDYRGNKLPNWLTSSLSCLAVLRLEKCKYCTSQFEAMASLEEIS